MIFYVNDERLDSDLLILFPVHAMWRFNVSAKRFGKNNQKHIFVAVFSG